VDLLLVFILLELNLLVYLQQELFLLELNLLVYLPQEFNLQQVIEP